MAVGLTYDEAPGRWVFDQETRWRWLSAGFQALLALAHLRVEPTYAQLLAGFGVETTAAYRSTPANTGSTG